MAVVAINTGFDDLAQSIYDDAEWELQSKHEERNIRARLSIGHFDTFPGLEK